MTNNANEQKSVLDIKVDRVQSLNELKALDKLNIDSVCISLADQVDPSRSVPWSELKLIRDYPFRGAFGIYYEPHLVSVQTCIEILTSMRIDFVQIDYSQLNHANCLKLKQLFENKVRFYCDKIVADTDSDFFWVRSDVEKATLWGCDYCIIDVFCDTHSGWEDLLTDKYDIKPSNLLNLAKNYCIGLNSNFDTSDLLWIAQNPYSSSVVINFKLSSTNHYDSILTISQLSNIVGEFQNKNF